MLLHLFLMCCLNVSVLSRYPPRYLMTLDLSMFSSSTFRLFVVHLFRCGLLPNSINSVLDSFILSLTASIHFLILSIDLLMAVITVCSSLLDFALKLILIEWSSANPFNSSLASSARVSLSVDA